MNEIPTTAGESVPRGTQRANHVTARETAVVSVLGPLEVNHAGSIRRTTGKLSDLLALLAIAQPNWLYSSSLVDALWGGEPTKTADTALRNYMSDLRELLPADAIERVQKQWRLNPAVVTLDLAVLHDLLKAGRTALASDPEAAFAAFDTARRLVRGDPYAGVDLQPVTDQRPIITELIRSVEDEWAGAAVASGQAGSKIAGLQELVDAEMLRESRTLSLMQALRAVGRRPEALRAYHRLYVHLRDEVGVRPGPDLVSLEQAILSETDDASNAVAPSDLAPASLWAQAADAMAGAAPLPDVIDEVLAGVDAAFAAGFGRQGFALLESLCDALSRPERGAPLVAVDRRIAIFSEAGERFGDGGDPALSRRFLTRAFDLAMTSDLPRAAAEILLGTVPNGRSFEADHLVEPMIHQCARALGSSPDDPLVIELWSELVCRTVLDNGLDDVTGRIVEQLRIGPSTPSGPRVESARLRALLHVDIADGTHVVATQTIDAALAAAVAADSIDHQADLLTIRARTALEAGDLVAWRNAVERAMDFASTTKRPLDLWARESIRATDALVRGNVGLARQLGDDAERIGRTHRCADVDITVASLWFAHCVLARTLLGEAKPTFPSLAVDVFAPLLEASFAGTLAASDPTLAFVVDQVADVSTTSARNLTTLPILALLSEVCWNGDVADHAGRLLKAIHSYDAPMVVMGLTPVSTLGPTQRYAGMLRGLLGDIDGAVRDFRAARRVAAGLASPSWEAAVLRDHALLLERQGDVEGAASAAAEARLLWGRVRP